MLKLENNGLGVNCCSFPRYAPLIRYQIQLERVKNESLEGKGKKEIVCVCIYVCVRKGLSKTSLVSDMAVPYLYEGSYDEKIRQVFYDNCHGNDFDDVMV